MDLFLRLSMYLIIELFIYTYIFAFIRVLIYIFLIMSLFGLHTGVSGHAPWGSPSSGWCGYESDLPLVSPFAIISTVFCQIEGIKSSKMTFKKASYQSSIHFCILFVIPLLWHNAVSERQVLTWEKKNFMSEYSM